MGAGKDPPIPVGLKKKNLYNAPWWPAARQEVDTVCRRNTFWSTPASSSSSSLRVYSGITPSRLCSHSERRPSKRAAKNGIFPSREDSAKGKMSQKQTHNRPRSVGEGRVEVGARSVEGEGTQPVDQLVELAGGPRQGVLIPERSKVSLLH